MALAGLVAVYAAIGPASGAPETEFDATPATASAPPVTVPPLVVDTTEVRAPAPVDGSQPGASTPTTEVPSVATASTVPRSPLADLVGPRGSAEPPAITARLQPTSLEIDDLRVVAPVRPVGLEPDGQLEVPDETEVGWYRYGSSPGRPGVTVLAAHVTWNHTTGPFYALRNLDPGAEIVVELDDGSRRHYEVIERAIYDKDSLPSERLWRSTGDEVLALITCGGSFNPDIRRYRQNIVVYAVPVAAHPDQGAAT